MYILKNAFKSITRAKGRNILVGIIVVLIAVASCIALSINNSAAEIVKNQEESTDIVATLNIDRSAQMSRMERGDMESIRNSMQSIEALTIDDIKLYGGSEYVKDYSYTLSGTINSTSIEAYSTESSDDSANQDSGLQNMPQGGDRQGGGSFMNAMIRGDFTIMGYSSEKAMTNFISGTSKITEGAMFDYASDEYTCVISDELAYVNDLDVGDKINFSNPSNEEEVYEFTICGIYQNESSDSTESQFRFSTAMDPANQIYVSYESLNKLFLASQTANEAEEIDETSETTEDSEVTALSGQVSSSFVLTGIDDIENFTEDVKAMGLDENYAVSTNADTIEKELDGIKQLSSFSSIFLLVVFAVGGLILIIINMINIRERKYEVGVLTAIGMNKGKVAVQFVTELFVVTFIALIIGSAVGAAVSVPTASAMLESQIESQENAAQEVQNNFGGPGGMSQSVSSSSGRRGGNLGNFFGGGQSEVNYVDQINAVINGRVLLELFGIGLLLTLVSSVVAIVFISRYSPLKILSERS